MKSFRYLFILIFLVPLPFTSCLDDDCRCDKRKFTVSEINRLDVAGTEGVEGADTVIVEGIVIDLIMGLEQIGISSGGFKPSLFSSAYACTCEPDNVQELISEISIVSSGDFDGFPAGSELNNLFTPEVGFRGGGNGIPLILLLGETVDDPVQGINRFGMLNPPSSISIHKFTVNFTLTNGQVFEGETTPIILIPPA